MSEITPAAGKKSSPVVNKNPLLTIAEAAAYCNVSPKTITRWIKPGELRAVRLGPATIRIRLSDLIAYIEACASI